MTKGKMQKPSNDIILGLEAQKLMGIKGPRAAYVKDIISARKFYSKKPVVLKLVSKQAVHKRDVGGVKIARDEKELESEFNELLEIIKKKKINDGQVLIQEFVAGHETIVGVKNDATFGHVIMFGIGGSYVEMIRDVSFRACPISEKDAEDMIEQLKFKALLEGARGGIKSNKKAIVNTLVHISKVAVAKKIQELDINPLIVDHKDAYAVDVRVVIV